MELSEYDLSYVLRTVIKSQQLADFITDFSTNEYMQAEKEMLSISKGLDKQQWNLEVDGSSNQRGNRLGIVLTSLEGNHIVRAIRYGFKTTNNEAEYEALLAGLTLARDMGISIRKNRTMTHGE